MRELRMRELLFGALALLLLWTGLALAFDPSGYDQDFSLHDSKTPDPFANKNETVPYYSSKTHIYGYFYDTDVPWNAGNFDNSGFWGFVFNKGVEQEGNITPYLHILSYYGAWGRFNKKFTGAYSDKWAKVTTTIGANLGVNYSPYVAMFNYRVLGVRISDMKWNAFGFANFALDGVYIFGSLARDFPSLGTFGRVTSTNPIVLDEGDVALNLKGKVGRLTLNNTLLRYHKKAASGNLQNQYYNNYSVEGNLEVIPKRVDLQAVYAHYQENKDWLGEVALGWDVFPKTFRLHYISRDSNFQDVNAVAVRGKNVWEGNKPEDHPGDYLYIADPFYQFTPFEADLSLKEIPVPLVDMARYGRSSNVGATFWFKAGESQNVLTLDFATKAPPSTPGNMDPRQLVGLETNYGSFRFKQSLSMLAPADGSPRQYYRLAVLAKPDFVLPWGLQGGLRFDFDRDLNYTSGEKNKVKTYALAGLQLSGKRNIWVWNNVQFDGIFLLGRKGSGSDWTTDPFKYALMARYTAPNQVRFRIQYFSSPIFADPPRDPYGVSRYKPYQWYWNDKNVSGWRVVVGVPF